MVEDDRRRRLRRLDDLLEALEQCNMHDLPKPPPRIAADLLAAGFDPEGKTTTQLIDAVLDRQQDYLIKVPIERRRAPRRKTRVDLGTWLKEGRKP
jgi:hypothetical protein